MDIEKKAKEIAERMKLRGLYDWQANDFIENLALPISTLEKEKLIEMVKFELWKIQTF